MSAIAKEQDIRIFAAPDVWAGNPNVALLQDGSPLIGFRCSAFPFRGDSDPTLRPYTMKAASIDAIAEAERVMVLDEPNSLTPGLFQRQDGTILAYFNRYGTHQPDQRAELEAAGKTPFTERDGLLFTREPITIMSSQDGLSWRRFSEIDLPDFLYPPAFRGNMLHGDGGSILLSAYTSRKEGGPRQMISLLIRSGDGGKTWELVSEIAEHPEPAVYFNETSLYRTAAGRLLAFLRIDGGDGHLYTAASEDDGATWQPFRRHEVYGFPHNVLRLPSGNVLLTYGARKPPMGVRGRLLGPDCNDIDEAEEFIIRGDSATGGCGYPAAVQLPDGRILVVYYLTLDAGGPACIEGSILREETKE